MKISGVPFDPGPYPQGPQHPVSVVCHRTYGNWAGDYAVGKGSRHGIGVHLLVGKDEGQWVQFYDTHERCNHAAGGNRDSIGIEVSGTDADRMTDWQVRALGHIVAELAAGDGIPAAHLDWGSGRVASFHGYRDHRQVAGSTHTDGWTAADWNRIAGSLGEDDDMTPDQAQQLANVNAAVGRLEKALAYNSADGIDPNVEQWTPLGQRVENIEAAVARIEARLDK